MGLARYALLMAAAPALWIAAGVRAAEAPVATAAPPAAIAANDARIVRMGRAVETAEGALRFAYPGMRLSFVFRGTSLSFDAWSSGTRSYLEAVIDGGPPRLIKLGREAQRIDLIKGTQAEQHVVEIMHRTETWHGVVTLAGFHAVGTIAPGAALPARKLLALGDSVTCASGVDRRFAANDSASTDPRHSWAMLTAAALKAQVHLVCYGGRGLVRSWNKRTDEFNLPDFYELAIPDPADAQRWDHARYQPDLIISAIGTNDFSPGMLEREAYVGAYERFVRTLLRNHPRARIVLTEGAILNGQAKDTLRGYLADVVRRVDDPRVSAIPSNHHPGDASDAHPTGAQHAAMALELVPPLRQTMGW